MPRASRVIRRQRWRRVGHSASPTPVTRNGCGAAWRFLRYVFDHKSWLVWDGRRWWNDNAGKIIELAKDTAKSIYCEAAATPDPDLGKALAQHATKSLNAPRINAMVDLARSDPRIVVQSSDLDCHNEVLGVANGVIDLRTGKLRSAGGTN
ncbi:MAG: hypothetical protein IPH55_01400 [Betaproteobacteria bacterium]|nr:hypothetical protein [Betaproteobacteria bacterium]